MEPTNRLEDQTQPPCQELPTRLYNRRASSSVESSVEASPLLSSSSPSRVSAGRRRGRRRGYARITRSRAKRARGKRKGVGRKKRKKKQGGGKKKRIYRRIFPVYQVHAAVALYFISVVTNNGGAERGRGIVLLV